MVALLCAGYPAAQFENGSVLKFGPLTQNCKRLRDSILSPIFHSYIFAMYKNESLWI
ncbi:hypothetical protein M099_0850 [Phocaeicola vulgatus str. 3975 RP4]|uniref:Uncharacterized protein n=1 Tax=Phocaeicola vulgatus str. 3975 RP4 TaxID=1339352 RepID=A0A069SMW4_PHOVU|nr:hypothetical protein M099_0850 [Phocaeicola vulgatus str. 3975 RP4]